MRFMALSLVATVSITALTAEGRPPTATTISGVVFDSLAMRGLPGATVQIAEANHARSATTTTDQSGRFVLSDIAAGTYLVGFFHPKLDSLGLESQVLRVQVRTDEPISVRLSIPSPRGIVRTVCGANSRDTSRGLMVGFLRGAENAMPRPHGTLSVRWSEIVIDQNAIRREIPTANATASASGQFALCGLPVSTPVMIQASSAADSSGSFEVTVPSTGLLHRDVYVAPVARTPIVVADSAPAVAVLRGTGRLKGRVAGIGGRALANARVMIWGTGLQATTNDSGYFSLSALPNGTHMLEARAVGFAPATVAVDIVAGASEDATMELLTLAVTLAKVSVTAERLFTSRQHAAFERRMRMGLGHIYDENELNRRNPTVLTDLFRMVPGLQVVPGSIWGEDVLVRGVRGGLCRPEVFVDGVRTAVDEVFPMNSVAPMQQVHAVEVYTHIVPAEFMTRNACGVIVIWTGGRQP